MRTPLHAVSLPVLLAASGSAQSHGLFTFEEGGGDLFGRAVAISPVTEFDELHPDVVVGAPADDEAGADAGALRVYGGVDGQLRFVRRGDAGDRYGQSVAVGDDWDLDGTLDLVVGAPQSGGPCVLPGYVEILSGADGEPLVTIAGEEPCSLFGSSVAVAGDSDGDGFAEIVVGAPGHGAGGAVFVVSPLAPANPLSGMASPIAGSRLGEAVAAYADYDGDGTPDYLAGAPGSSFSGSQAGSAFLLSGADSGILRQYHGPSARSYLGSAVAAADVTGDGIPDILLGAPQTTGGVPLTTGPGFVEVVSGHDGHAPVTTLLGTAHGDAFGASLAPVGDVDGDGDAEIAVGAPRTAQGGTASLWSVGPDEVLYETSGARSGQALGAGLGGGFDVNRDGTLDFVAGAPGAGSARVLSTQPLGMSADVHEISLAAGGVMTASIDAGPENAFLAYWVLGSASGTVPGTFLVNAHVPLNWDAYFCELFVYPNTGPLTNNLGSLSSEGKGTMKLTIGAGSLGPPYLGLFLQHAYIVFNPGNRAAPVKVVGAEIAPLTLVE